jgi:hypothetical protein
MGRKSKELSPNKKEVIVNLKLNGHKISEISRMLSIPEITCRSVIKTYNERKSLKKLVVLDGQEKCLLVVKPDWSAWWKKNVQLKLNWNEFCAHDVYVHNDIERGVRFFFWLVYYVSSFNLQSIFFSVSTMAIALFC